MPNKNFYRAFEEKYRGSRNTIKGRIKIYLPFILKLKELYPDSAALDIGCGRGEWLELLKDNGISAQGIDIDSGMLEACHKLGLDVTKGMGLQYLKGKKDNSITIVSAFHVVEHISFDDLQELVKQSLRVLKPGGLLILETPNPENIKVATEYFYLDPTHIKPIPSDLLSFLPEFCGYARTKVLRLNESKILAEQNGANIIQLLEGVSPDYAVVAQKKADSDILEPFDNVFNQDFGLSLTSLCTKFERRFLDIEAKASEAEAKASEAKAKASEAEAKASEAEARIKNVTLFRKIKSVFPIIVNRLKATWSSLFNFSKLALQSPSSAKIVLKRKILSWEERGILRLKQEILKRSRLRHALFTKCPTIYSFIKKIYVKFYVSKHSHNKPTLQDDNVLMSPRAQRIYNQIISMNGK